LGARLVVLMGLLASLIVAAPVSAAAPNKAKLVVSVLGGGKVVSTPSAINCPAKCSHTFYRGAVVRLTPKPSKGWRFGHWTGACHGSGACLLRLQKTSSVAGAVFAALPLPPAVEVHGLSVCPASDTRVVDLDANGQPYLACNRDWSAAPFAAGNKVVCSGNVHFGVGHTFTATIVFEGAELFFPGNVVIDRSDAFFTIYHSFEPAIRPGNYACRVKLDGEVFAERPFSISG
jgi:hypothetical protein